MREHECRLVLHIKITTQLKRAMALRAVHKDCDGQQVVTDGELPAGKDRGRCDRELVLAAYAAEHLAGLVGVAIEATAIGTDRLAFSVRPADQLESFPSLLIRHARDGRQTERP